MTKKTKNSKEKETYDDFTQKNLKIGFTNKKKKLITIIL